MGFFMKGLAIICLAVVLQHVIKLGLRMGYLKNVYYHEPGPCHVVDKIFDGSEDLQTLPSGLAIISSGLVFGAIGTSDGKPILGALYTFDFNHPEVGVVKLGSDVPIENPHGISLWEDPDTGTVTIFLVSHARRGELIEKFEFNQKNRKLKHIRSIQDPLFYCINDMVATGPDSFYVTNYMRTTNKLTQSLEVWLLIHAGSVVFYDGSKAQIVISGLLSPNGINRSPDGRFLYIAQPIESTVSIYTKLTDTTFKLQTRYTFDGMPDNIDVAGDGSLWVGVHAVGHRVLEHLSNKKAESPSQVLRIQMHDGNITHVEEIYSGVLVSGSTVGSYHKGAMLVGTIHTELMYCKVLHLAGDHGTN